MMPGRAQDFQVVADGGLGQGERGGEVADAGLAALVRPDQGHQPQPDRVAERAEYLSEPCGCGIPDRFADQRDAAFLGVSWWAVAADDRQQGLASVYRHGSILTPVDAGWQAGLSCIDCHL